MKKLYPYILALLSIILLTPLHAQDFYRTTSNLNMRILPTTSSSVVTVIPAGSKIMVIQHINNEWAEIHYNGHTNYVSRRYIRPYTHKTNYGRNYQQSRTRYYRNVDGYKVQSPTHYRSAPEGATAICRDGTYSFSRNRRGTCSHHGGVAVWL